MSAKKSPRVALVTGANRGLGLETSRQLRALGLQVVMTGRDEASLQKARRELGGRDDGLIVVAMDVADAASIQAAQREVLAQVPGVDVLVNNAAVLLFDNRDVLAIPADGFQQAFATNVFGVVEVCRVFAPAMAERGYGRIVNVSSGAGQLTRMSTYAPAYSMSKTALNAFTRILAGTYRDRGVLVNAVDPGWVRTDMGGRAAPRSVEEGADTIVWLATLPDGGPTAGFFRDRRPIDW
jgi:NAD(P)-dependent dehydrogenase (short-subunit alcohol dehydrogenase family)